MYIITYCLLLWMDGPVNVYSNILFVSVDRWTGSCICHKMFHRFLSITAGWPNARKGCNYVRDLVMDVTFSLIFPNIPVPLVFLMQLRN